MCLCVRFPRHFPPFRLRQDDRVSLCQVSSSFPPISLETRRSCVSVSGFLVISPHFGQFIVPQTSLTKNSGTRLLVCWLLVGCFATKQPASDSQGRIAETVVCAATPRRRLQVKLAVSCSLYTGTFPSSRSADPTMPGAGIMEADDRQVTTVSQSNHNSTIGTLQTEYHEALPSSASVQSHLSSSFADDGNAS